MRGSPMKSARTAVAPPLAPSPSPSTAAKPGAAPSAGWPVPSPGAPWLVHVPTLLALACFLPLTTERVQQNAHLFWTFVAVPGALLLWRYYRNRR